MMFDPFPLCRQFFTTACWQISSPPPLQIADALNEWSPINICSQSICAYVTNLLYDLILT